MIRKHLFQVVTDQSVPLRLRGPFSVNGIGRVEVLYHGQWGTICDDRWDISDARVACRQLGYPDVVRALQGEKVPSGSGRIWLDNVACTGNERNITSCPYLRWGNHDCGHSEDAGVECSTTGEDQEGKYYTKKYVEHPCRLYNCGNYFLQSSEFIHL